MWKNTVEPGRSHSACALRVDNEGYKHTLVICNTYYFSTTTMVTWTRPNVTLYVHCLSCYFSLPFSLL